MILLSWMPHMNQGSSEGSGRRPSEDLALVTTLVAAVWCRAMLQGGEWLVWSSRAEPSAASPVPALFSPLFTRIWFCLGWH